MMDIAKSETFKNFIILNKALLFLILLFSFASYHYRLRSRSSAPRTMVTIRSGILEDVLGFEDVLEDTF